MAPLSLHLAYVKKALPAGTHVAKAPVADRSRGAGFGGALIQQLSDVAEHLLGVYIFLFRLLPRLVLLAVTRGFLTAWAGGRGCLPPGTRGQVGRGVRAEQLCL